MLGNDAVGRGGLAASAAVNRDEWGVIPRAVHALFQALHREQARHGSGAGAGSSPGKAPSSKSPGAASSSFRFSVHCSMLQIYNESIHDLLSTSAQYGEGEALRIREGEVGEGLAASALVSSSSSSSCTWRACRSSASPPSEMPRCCVTARRRAPFGHRSTTSLVALRHPPAAWTETRPGGGGGDDDDDDDDDDDEGRDEDAAARQAQPVDLAGSEKMNVSKDAAAMTKRHVQELTSINKSLSSLGNVIAVLADIGSGKNASTHVPYRDSKLTRLLQDSLGGTTRTVVVACAGPAAASCGRPWALVRDRVPRRA